MCQVHGVASEKKFFRSRAQFINLSLVLLISLGDTCVGVYLINVFAVDQWYKTDFCPQRYTYWGVINWEKLGAF